MTNPRLQKSQDQMVSHPRCRRRCWPRCRHTKKPIYLLGAYLAGAAILFFSATNHNIMMHLSAEAKIFRGINFRRKPKPAFPSSVYELVTPRGGGTITKNHPPATKTQHPVPPSPPPPPTSSKANGNATEQENNKDDPRILMLIRLLFITYYGSLGSLLPYLPVYYHSLGHGGQIIGMLGAIKPFTTFLVAPFWGIVSDQTGSPFTVLYFTFLVSLVAQLLVAWKHDPKYIMFMVFVTAFFNAPVKSLLDSMVMSHLHDRSRYGRLRLWGQLGFGLGSSGVGVLLSRSKHRPYKPTDGHSLLEKLDNFWQSLTGYKLLFLTHAMMSIPTWWCIRAFHKLHDEKEQEKAAASAVSSKTSSSKKTEVTSQVPNVGVLGGINVLLHNADALLFFFLVFVVGVSSGLIENFAYVRIREVGGTGKDMGLSRLISSLAGAPMFWFSGPLTEVLGADRVIVVSICSYILRFLIYAGMRNPLQGLPAEALRGVTFAAFWSTCTIYASRIAPPGMSATMLMFLNAMYGGLGQSMGAIIGGKLQSHLGTVRTFLYAAAFDLCFVTLVIMYLKIRKDSSFKNPQPIVPKVVNKEV